MRTRPVRTQRTPTPECVRSLLTKLLQHHESCAACDRTPRVLSSSAFEESPVIAQRLNHGGCCVANSVRRATVERVQWAVWGVSMWPLTCFAESSQDGESVPATRRHTEHNTPTRRQSAQAKEHVSQLSVRITTPHGARNARNHWRRKHICFWDVGVTDKPSPAHHQHPAVHTSAAIESQYHQNTVYLHHQTTYSDIIISMKHFS